MLWQEPMAQAQLLDRAAIFQVQQIYPRSPLVVVVDAELLHRVREDMAEESYSHQVQRLP